jgi:uncharacterized protein (DUF488 family)
MDQPAGPAPGAAVLGGPRAAPRSQPPGSGRGPCLLTVGHGTMTSEGFIDLLRAAAVERVVDVRSVPGSRRHPQFALDQLAFWLPDVDIGYRWEPRLGGFRRPRPDSPNVALRHASFRAYADHMASPEFVAALAEVVAGAATRKTAAMCAETLWWRCHRRLIADAAVLLHGICVRHLAHDGRLADHRLTDGIRFEEGKLVYDAA